MNKTDGTWLLAVSAGPDSMALLDMCLKKKMKIAVAHVNYHHRDQAEEEEEYLRSFCEKRSIPFFVRNEPFHWDGNFEACARIWRYDFFEKIVKENGYRGVMTAHQQDDLLETYLMQRERHLVPDWYGLREEMQYHGILVKRPLLHRTKKELQEYCDIHHIHYFIDETNADLSITRNRIRHDTVSKMNHQAREEMEREIEHLNAEKSAVEKRAGNLLNGRVIRLNLYRKAEDHERYTALRMMLDEDHITLRFIQQADDIIMHHENFMIPFRDEFIVREDDSVFIWHEMKAYEDVYPDIASMKQGRHGCYEIRKGSPSIYAVTLSKEDFPITIRSFHEGDAIRMRFGTKQVSRFFIDRQIPLFKRKSWPVVLNCHHEVILVPGLGCDKSHYSPKPTVNVLQYTQNEENA